MEDALNNLQTIPVGDEFDGFDVFVVGGAVRDALRGETPDDIDLMAVARPGEVSDSVAALTEQMPKRVNPETSFPVFMDSHNREVALPRTEQSTGRGFQDFDMNIVPADVPVRESVEIDLERRDLTMNAMAYNIRDAELFDPFGGRDAINNGRVQHVSDAFSEDPLRVVRMARFAGRFDATVTNKTRLLATEIAPAIAELPRERISRELRKVFKQSERPDRFFTELERADALRFTFPSLSDADMDTVTDTIRVVRERVGRDILGLFTALGASLESERIDRFVENNRFTNDEENALRDGRFVIDNLSDMGSDNLDTTLTVSKRVERDSGISRDALVGLANTRSDVDSLAVDQTVGIGVAAVENVTGRSVMKSDGIGKADIGTKISGSEFGQLVTNKRKEYMLRILST